ncbi:alanine racemase [Embleya hyalina]|nr:alanine racemase [Embleya hyalina]
MALDVAAARAALTATATAFAGFRVRYAVKANPHPALLRSFAARGIGFDVASVAEADLCLDAGADAAHLTYGNPIRSTRDIARAYDRGVRVFALDTADEARRLGAVAPGAGALIRLAVEPAPAGRKFGCLPREATTIASSAARAGLDVVGLALHIGTQRRDPRAWDAAVASAARVWELLRRTGMSPRVLDLGGGLPARDRRPTPPLTEFATAIRAAVARGFDEPPAEVAINPGRVLVAEAAVLFTTVHAVAHREDAVRWVFLGAGVWNAGLVDGRDGRFEYPVTAPDFAPDEPVSDALLGGPTCDGADVLRAGDPYRLPSALREGDRVAVWSVGAYTTTTAAVGFNGLAPLPVHVVG